MKNPEKLLDLLAQDARLTPAQLAAMLGESEEDVAAAIKAYEKNSTILGYKTVVDWDKTSKESVTALIEVKITPQKGMGFDEIARQIFIVIQIKQLALLLGEGLAVEVKQQAHFKRCCLHGDPPCEV